MSEFTKGHDYLDELNVLRHSTKDYPLELQLVWLFEILMILTYISNVKRKRRMQYKKVSNTYVVTSSSCIALMTSKISDNEVMKLLCAFRNLYVHAGCFSKASKKFQELISNHCVGLNELAKIAQIKLNYEYTLYAHYPMDHKDIKKRGMVINPLIKEEDKKEKEEK